MSDWIDLGGGSTKEEREHIPEPVLASVHQLRPGPPKSRRRAMLDDPRLTGTMLLIALVMDELFHSKEYRFEVIKEATGLGPALAHHLRRDIPRYDPPPQPRKCMVKGPRGGQCPRPARFGHALHDPDDGTVSWLAGCKLTTHFTWAQAEARRHEETAGATAPLPVYNTRSVLAPHFPTINWPKWWAKFPRVGRDPYDATRDPVYGSGEVVPQIPTLRVVRDERGAS